MAALTRSQVMGRIRGKNMMPEVALRKRLWAMGYRYRVNYQSSCGRLDIAFPQLAVAILVNGCFWHGCPDHYVRPRTRSDFWAQKLRQNVDRDRSQTLKLEENGWDVIHVWEHEIVENADACAVDVAKRIQCESPRARDWRVVRVVELNEESAIEERFCESLRDPEIRRTSRRVRQTMKTGRPIEISSANRVIDKKDGSRR